MQLPFALHKKIGSVCLHSKMWIDLSNHIDFSFYFRSSEVVKLWHWVSGIPQENNMTVEKKSKWQKIETKSCTFSAFVVHYRQSRLEISSRGTLQLFAAWKLPVIPVQNLRCRWNVSLQGLVGFWSSVLTSLARLRVLFSLLKNWDNVRNSTPHPRREWYSLQYRIQYREGYCHFVEMANFVHVCLIIYM